MKCVSTNRFRGVTVLLAAMLFGAPSAKPQAFEVRPAMQQLKGVWSGEVAELSPDVAADKVPVSLLIDNVSGEEFSGTMEWPTFGGCTTEVHGLVEGTVVKWSEVAYVKGDDVVLYGLYIGRLEQSGEIAGEWMDPKHAIYPKGPKFGVTGATFVLRKEENR